VTKTTTATSDLAVSGSRTVGADDREVLMVKLGLREEDLDDIVFEEEGSQHE
jgi:hypothetical protein